MIKYLVPKCFDKEFLDSIDDKSNKTMKERWTEKWVSEYSDWFSFGNIEATASQCSVFATHYISERTLQTLTVKPANRPSLYITVHIAEEDELMPPAKQNELGRILQI